MSSIDVRWLRRRYLVEGAPVELIAQELDLNIATVHRAINAAGIPRRGKPGARPYVALDPEWLAAQIKGGLTAHAIAAEAGVDRSSVVWQLAEHQLFDVSDEPRAARAAELYQAGASLVEVARALGVTRRPVTIWLMALGVTIHGPGRRTES